MTKYQSALNIINRIEEAGFIAYLAGGCVRDQYLGLPCDDYDIATSAPIARLYELFPHHHKVGAQFQIILIIENTYPFEVAVFRKDGQYHDGRKPQSVFYASPEEDARRRDFTINGLFFHPPTQHLLDYVGGEKDLKQGVIQTIGDPNQRFKEDKLRLIRAFRFAASLKFKIHPQTLQAIEVFSNELFPSVSVERVWAEFGKAHKKGALAKMLELMLNSSLFSAALPFEKARDIGRRLKKLAFAGVPLSLFFAHLYSHLSKDHLDSFFLFFKTSNKEKSLALSYWEFSHYIQSYQIGDPLLPFVKALDKKPFSLFFSFFQKNDLSGKKEDITQYVFKALAPFFDEKGEFIAPLKAIDLLNRGIHPGKSLGILLQRAWELKLQNPQETKERILDRLI